MRSQWFKKKQTQFCTWHHRELYQRPSMDQGRGKKCCISAQEELGLRLGEAAKVEIARSASFTCPICVLVSKWVLHLPWGLHTWSTKPRVKSFSHAHNFLPQGISQWFYWYGERKKGVFSVSLCLFQVMTQNIYTMSQSSFEGMVLPNSHKILIPY